MPGEDGLPAGLVLHSSTLTARRQALYPRDARRPAQSRSRRLSFEATLEGPMGPDQQPAKVKVTGKQVVQLQMSDADDVVASVPDA
jgi:hypothetical protein